MSNIKHYLIFGQTIKVIYDQSLQSKILKDELEIYPLATEGSTSKFTVHINHFPTRAWIANNPKDFQYAPSSYLIRSMTYTKQVEVDEAGNIDCYFRMNGHKASWKRAAQKILNKQFKHREENIGQAFHEIVLMTLLALTQTLSPIHASAFVSPDGDAFLIGGTGGVGKTSSEIELCFHRSFEFLADDISVTDQDGWCYPNLSYPKIYAYNLVGSSSFKNTVLVDRSILEKIHWSIWKRIGLDKVRRRCSPASIYGSHRRAKTQINNYYLLAKTGNDAFRATDISIESAVATTIGILKNELHGLLSEIRKLEFNAALMGHTPFTTEQTVIDNWSKTLTQAFSKANLKVIQIPKNVEHQTLKASIANYIETNSFE